MARTQRTFHKGEISPALQARADLSLYYAGAKKLRNFNVALSGGAVSRPGTLKDCEVKDSERKVILVPFEATNGDKLVLEFGHEYIRVIKNGEPFLCSHFGTLVLTNGVAVTPGSTDGFVIEDISNALSAVVTVTAHGLSSGHEIRTGKVHGMPSLSYRSFKIANVTTDTFELRTLPGDPVDTTNAGTFDDSKETRGWVVLEIPTPYQEDELPDLLRGMSQSGDVLVIAHADHAPRKFTYDGSVFSLSVVSFLPSVQRPTNIPRNPGSHNVTYQFTAFDKETGEESLPGLCAPYTITNITKSNPAVITLDSGTFLNGEKILIDEVEGMTELNGREFSVEWAGSGNNYKLIGENSTNYSAYVSGGKAIATQVAATVPFGGFLVIPTVSGCEVYNVYASPSGVHSGPFGFVGSCTAPPGAQYAYFPITGIFTFVTDPDLGPIISGRIEPDYTDTPPYAAEVFNAPDKYPSVAQFIQQRLALGGSKSKPETIEMSRIGRYFNFTRSFPIKDDDAISFTIADGKLNPIRDLVDISGMIALTDNAEFSIEGAAGGAFVPGGVEVKKQSRNGVSKLPALTVGGDALFVQALGSKIRNLAFSDQRQGYEGVDLTVYSSHLFENRRIVDWAYQQEPNSTVYAVRDDGIMLCMTYFPEQEVIGWTWYDTDGKFENVCAIREGDKIVLYAVVRREIQLEGSPGSTRIARFVEKFTPRLVTEESVQNYVGMDCSVSWSGEKTDLDEDPEIIEAMSVTLSGGTSWDHEEELMLQTSVFTVDEDIVGQGFVLRGSKTIRFVVTQYLDATTVKGRVDKTVPEDMRNDFIFDFAFARNYVDGLWHLEGKQVSVLADGHVISSPNNPEAGTPLVVQNGRLQIPDNGMEPILYSKIHVGLPYVCDLQTLAIESSSPTSSLIAKGILINRVDLMVEKSRGIFAGSEFPKGDNPIEGLNELKIRDEEHYDEPVKLLTGHAEILIESHYQRGEVALRQVDPLPLQILSITASGHIPGGRR